jgi:hypothetical protein
MNFFMRAAGTFNPLNLNPFLWVDAISGEFASTVDNNGSRTPGNVINSATAETGQSLTNAGTLASKGIYNGEGWYMKVGAQFTTGVAADYNFLHNGGDFDVWVTWKQLTAAAGNTRALLNNNGFSNTARGILVYYDNTGSLNAIKLRIGNGAAAVISIDVNNAVVQNTTNTLRITKSGNVVTVYINGVQRGTQTAVLAFSAGDATSTLAISSVTAATVAIYLKDLIILNRALSVSEASSMNGRTFTSVVPDTLNTDIIVGDSNAEGQVPNGSIAAALTGTHNTKIFKLATSAVQNSDYIERLQLAVNQKVLNQNLTLHGGEMRLGYSFASNPITRAILKFGQGSTSASDWTSPSLVYTRWIAIIPRFLEDMYHAHRKKIVLRSMVFWHGANDCQLGDGADYESTIIALVKATIDKFIESTPTFETLVKMRHVVFRTRSGGAGFDATAYNTVITAQTNLGNGSFLAAHPTYNSYYLGSVSYSTEAEPTLDSVHYSNYDTMATQAFNYLSPYSSE